MPAVIEQTPTLRERFDSVREDLQVRWFMLDAQKKQAVILLGLYVGYTLLDLGGAIMKSRLSSGGNG